MLSNSRLPIPVIQLEIFSKSDDPNSSGVVRFLDLDESVLDSVLAYNKVQEIITHLQETERTQGIIRDLLFNFKMRRLIGSKESCRRRCRELVLSSFEFLSSPVSDGIYQIAARSPDGTFRSLTDDDVGVLMQAVLKMKKFAVSVLCPSDGRNLFFSETLSLATLPRE